MGRFRTGLNALDVRTKLLLMLGVLSLPLLIVGLYQLHQYRSGLGVQSAAIARAEAEAAASALESWIESHPAQAAEPDKLSTSDARELYTRLTRRARPGSQSAIAVYDAQGRVVVVSSGAQLPVLSVPPAHDRSPETPTRPWQTGWSDGASRVTSVIRTSPSGWSVAVGVPAPEGTRAGRSILLLAFAWFLTLVASCFLDRKSVV